MKKNYLLIITIALISINSIYGQGEKFFLDFEGAEPLNNLPMGVENVNGSNTVLVKGTDSYAPIPNEVLEDADVAGENELFLDFHGYLKMDLENPSEFSIAYDYRRTDDNDDWWLGFITFIGNDGTDNRLEQFLIREWSGQLHYDGNNTSDNQLVSFNTNYHIVLTSSGGDIKAYVNGAEVLNVPYNAGNGKNIHEWSDASLLLSFKGNSYDGTSVTPEPEFDQNARDTRVFVDNIALFDRELTPEEVTQLFNDGNDTLSIADIDVSPSFSMFPNPVQNNNSVSVTNPEVHSVKIFNILGKEINNQVLIDSSFNVESISSGTYFVQFFNAEQKPMGVSKLIK